MFSGDKIASLVSDFFTLNYSPTLLRGIDDSILFISASNTDLTSSAENIVDCVVLLFFFNIDFAFNAFFISLSAFPPL